MNAINVKRWLAGGLVTGLLVFVIEGLASMTYMHEMQESLERVGLTWDEGAGTFALALLVSLAVGLVAVFIYTGLRATFGPGPKTAVISAVALWCGGYFPSLVGYQMLGLFPGRLLVHWGLIGIVELIIATVAGAALYKPR